MYFLKVVVHGKQSLSSMKKFDRMRAILSAKYFEKELHKNLIECEQSYLQSILKKNYTMHPVKNVQAVLLISADVELCLRISTSGEGFQNLLR